MLYEPETEKAGMTRHTGVSVSQASRSRRLRLPCGVYVNSAFPVLGLYGINVIGYGVQWWCVLMTHFLACNALCNSACWNGRIDLNKRRKIDNLSLCTPIPTYLLCVGLSKGCNESVVARWWHVEHLKGCFIHRNHF